MKLHAPRPPSRIQRSLKYQGYLWTDCGKTVVSPEMIAESADKVNCKGCLHKRLLREERAMAWKSSGQNGDWLDA